MAQLPAYEQYQPIDYDYVKQLPTGWQLWKIAHAFNLIGSGTTPESGNEKFYINGSINWINTGDLNDGVLESCKNKITKEAFKKHSVLKIYPKGTLLIAMYGATIGKVAVTNIESCTNQACCALSKSKILTNKFTLYWFIANRKNIVNLSYGGGQPNISQDVIKKLKIPVPPLDTQNRIVEYLDKKNNEIDRFIRNKERLIALLEEQKKEIINQCVTLGLDKNVKLKETELGQIPEHWEIRRLGTIGRFSKGGNISRSELTTVDNSIADVSAVLYGDIYTKYDIVADNIVNKISTKTASYSVQLKNGDLLFTGSGETKEDIGKCVLFNSDQKTYAGGDVIIFKQTIFDSHFISYSQNSFMAKYQKYNSAKGEIIVHTYGSKLRDVTMPYPSSIEEQKQIVEFINKEHQVINLAISKAQQEITAIKEYREALITDLVTGKRCLPPSIPK